MDLVRRRMALHRAKLGDFLPTGARYSAKTPFWCAARMPFSPHCGLMYPQGAAKAVTSFLLLSFSIPQKSVQKELHPAADLLRFIDK